jgi:AcrR family transcriptional regulator
MARARSKKAETSITILEAAKKVLRHGGQAGLSTREVAKAAGVPLSQIHYHFGSKLGLLLALFDHLNVQLLDRQNAMFQDESLSLSQRWDKACDYLDEDIASGYVRVLQELIAASWSEPEVAKVVREGGMGWIDLLTGVARKAEQELGGLGPFSALEAATLVANAFIGAESLYLLGAEKKGAPIRQALRRVGDAIRLAERKSGKPTGKGSHARQAAD